MIAGLKPYPVMKDSMVPWLGEVPEHWNGNHPNDYGKLSIIVPLVVRTQIGEIHPSRAR